MLGSVIYTLFNTLPPISSSNLVVIRFVDRPIRNLYPAKRCRAIENAQIFLIWPFDLILGSLAPPYE